MPRVLRPHALLAGADAIWLVDEVQPVAARLDPVDGGLLGLVDWRGLEPPGRPQRPVACDRTRLWVQWGERLVCVDADGVRCTAEVPGLELLAAGGPGAWLVGPRYAETGDPHHGVPAPPLPPGVLALVTPDGELRRIAVDRLPVDARADATALRLRVYLQPPTAVRVGEGSYGFDYHEAVYRLPYPALAGDRVSVTEYEPAAFEPEPPHLSWLSPDEPGWEVDGRTWRVGRLGDGFGHDREIVAAVYAADGTQVRRVPLGRGHVLVGLPAHGRLWFLLLRREPGGARRREVVALDPSSHTVTTVVACDGIDVSAHRLPLPAAPPPQARPHAESRLAWFAEVWRDGFADMTDVDVALVGRWPDTAVEVTFGHHLFPGGRLRRRVALFDELGRPADVEYSDIGLMEDLDTADLPPVSEAVDGVLHI